MRLSRRQVKRKASARIVLKYLVVNVVVLCVFILVADFVQAALRASSIRRQFGQNPRYHLGQKKYRAKSSLFHHGIVPLAGPHLESWGFDPFWSFSDQYGLRSHSADASPYPRPFTLVMGDSFAEGVGVDFEKVFSSYLPGNIKNSGVISHSPVLQGARLEWLEALGERPERLVWLINPSDVIDEYNYQFIEGFQPPALISDAMARAHLLEMRSRPGLDVADVAALEGRLPSFWRALKLNLVLPRFLLGSLGVSHPKELISGSNCDSFLDRIENQWKSSDCYNKLRKVWAVSSHPDIDSVLKKSKPLVYSAVERQLKRNPNRRIDLVFYLWPDQITRREAVDGPYRSFVNGFRKLAGQYKSLKVCDLTELIKPGEVPSLFIPGDVHWNVQGHQRIANGLKKCMEKP